MKEILITVRNTILGFLYRNILKRIFFLGDPEDVHDGMIKMGMLLGKISLTRKLVWLLFGYSHPILKQKILGIEFPNPIGLSAGFDKDAVLTDITGSVGFGFEEVGSITGEVCKGNPRPRLWRLKKSKSICVYYGLKNDGCETISKRLSEKKFSIPIGTSIAKTNDETTVETTAGVADYVKAYKHFIDIGSYTTINISCPNTCGGEPFTDPKKLEKLLPEIDTIVSQKPIFLKIASDLATEQLDDILEVISRHKVHGLICTNLLKDRSAASIKDTDVPSVGGMSGKILEERANEIIRYVYQKTKGKYVIIGCGGVFCAHDAYRKIRLGASLIQMITGMIYEGPQVISEINQGLIQLLKRDGFTNISEAVGADNRE